MGAEAGGVRPPSVKHAKRKQGLPHVHCPVISDHGRICQGFHQLPWGSGLEPVEVAGLGPGLCRRQLGESQGTAEKAASHTEKKKLVSQSGAKDWGHAHARTDEGRVCAANRTSRG